MREQTESERIDELTAQVAAMEGDLTQLRQAAALVVGKVTLMTLAPTPEAAGEMHNAAEALAVAATPPEQRAGFEAALNALREQQR